jgi:alanyl-tRNA synthetase
MKQSLLLLAACFAFAGTPLFPQTSASDAVAAELQRREAEERQQRLTATLQSIQESQDLLLKRQQALQDRVLALERENERLKEENARLSANAVSHDELKKFVDVLKEVDQKRQQDRELVLEKFKELASLKIAAAPEPRTAPRSAAQLSEEVAIHKVSKDERLLDIIEAYNRAYKERGLGTITLADVKRENPKLNPDRIRKGQEIRIPIPAKK